MSRNALLSVFRKDGVEEFARQLLEFGFNLFASGGTCRKLQEAGLPVRDVAELVGGGAILGHKVVTLSREVHAGLLADYEAELEEMESLGLPYMDLVAVDLYPLSDEIAKPDATDESIRQQTDIGGPTMLRSGAKGRRIVISSPDQYDEVLAWLKAGEPEAESTRRQMAASAEAVVSEYALQSARHLSDGRFDGLMGWRQLQCKYGENAWQSPAAFYAAKTEDPLALDQFELVAGTDPSYNNLVEIGDRQVQTITHIAAGFERNFGQVPLVAIGTKHGNCCGAAVGDDPGDVLMAMLEGDLRAIHGGLVMTNFTIDEKMAEILLSWNIGGAPRRLLDAISAPSFTESAIGMLRRKGDKCRFLQNPALAELTEESLDSAPRFRYVRGGFLKQPNYGFVLDFSDPDFTWVYGEPDEQVRRDAVLGWAIGSTSNSNTITLTRGSQLIGNGTGQQDRVGAAELALKRAKDSGNLHFQDGSRKFEGWDKGPRVVAYSDSFFPFDDGPNALLEAGVWTIISTSGSVNDRDVEDAFLQVGLLGWLPDAAGRGFAFH